MYKLLLLFHFVQSLTDCAANNSTISRGVVGKEGADWRVKLTPCDCCNANRSLSLSPALSACEVAAIFICQHIQRPKMSIFRKKMALFCVTLARITTSTTSWVRMRRST